MTTKVRAVFNLFTTGNPIIIAIVLTIFNFGGFWFLPAAILFDHYPNVTFTPFDAVGLFPVIINMTFGVTSSWALVLWFPRASNRFVRKLSKVSQSRRSPGQIVAASKKQIAGVIILVLLLYIPFLFTLAADDVTEWFEVTGWLGWFCQSAVNIIPLLTAGLAIFVWMPRLTIWCSAQLQQPLDVHALNPDECGGLSFIGKFYGWIGLYVIAIGTWAFGVIAIDRYLMFKDRTLESVPIEAYANATVMLLVYAVFIWFMLFRPVLQTHHAMVRARNLLVQRLSDRFDIETNIETDFYCASAYDRLRKINDLIRQHDLLMENYPVWPFTVNRLLSLSVLALLPPVLGIAASIVQIMTRPG